MEKLLVEPVLENELRQRLISIRQQVLELQLSEDERQRTWKLFLGLGADRISAQNYLKLVERGPSPYYDKIKKDTDRTFKSDAGFHARVSEGQLIRLLNAFIHNTAATTETDTDEDLEQHGWKFTYVQGMNVMAGMFLYAMPSEPEAFYCFDTFIRHLAPHYVQPMVEGVHAGIKLVDETLRVVDPELSKHFQKTRLLPESYAFANVMTFCAATPPLQEALKIWDFLLTHGMHFNVLCVIAQLELMRDKLLLAASPMALVRTYPDLNAANIVEKALGLRKKVPDELWYRIMVHPYSPSSTTKQVHCSTPSEKILIPAKLSLELTADDLDGFDDD